MQSLEEPLEIGVATSNGRDGSGGAGLIHVNAVVGVDVTPFSYLLRISDLLCRCVRGDFGVRTSGEMR